MDSTETPGIIDAIKKMAKANDITLTKNFIKNICTKIHRSTLIIALKVEEQIYLPNGGIVFSKCNNGIKVRVQR